ncbi:MAG TPA: hypothetical protein VGG28_32210 [Kofleriaceae bacterium]
MRAPARGIAVAVATVIMKTIKAIDLANVTGGTHTGDPPPLRIETPAERRKRFIDRIQDQPIPSESEPGLGF